MQETIKIKGIIYAIEDKYSEWLSEATERIVQTRVSMKQKSKSFDSAVYQDDNAVNQNMWNYSISRMTTLLCYYPDQ